MIKLGELAWACYLYTRITDYDSAFLKFKELINNSLDLSNSNHRNSLLTWLNKWGCRQFSKKYHKLASNEISKWNSQYILRINSLNKNLLCIKKAELKEIADIYEQLRNCVASKRKTRTKKGANKKNPKKKSSISFGPTGASKILFAVMPNTVLPWDEPIRNEFNYSGNKTSYFKYLQRVKRELKSLSNECKKKGILFKELPKFLNRPHSFLPKLIDEYYWITITNDCPFPSETQIKSWIKWNK